MGRPRHPDQDLEQMLSDAEDHHWTVDYNKKTNYWRALCDCGKHKKWIHKSPSGGHYALNLRKWFERQPCWKTEEETP